MMQLCVLTFALCAVLYCFLRSYYHYHSNFGEDAGSFEFIDAQPLDESMKPPLSIKLKNDLLSTIETVARGFDDAQKHGGRIRPRRSGNYTQRQAEITPAKTPIEDEYEEIDKGAHEITRREDVVPKLKPVYPNFGYSSQITEDEIMRTPELYQRAGPEDYPPVIERISETLKALSVPKQRDNIQFRDILQPVCRLDEEGNYPHPYSCTKYLACRWGRVSTKICPLEIYSYFNPKTGFCDVRTNVECARSSMMSPLAVKYEMLRKVTSMKYVKPPQHP